MKNRNTEKPPGNIYDTFAKNYLGKVFVFSDFLQSYADEEFVREIDVKKIEPEPTHYFDKDGSEKITDLLFSCPLKKGEAKAVIVFEHQSGSIKKLPIKLLAYASAIWSAELKSGKKTLSALYFLVLRTGKKPVRHRTTLADWLPKSNIGKPIGVVPEIDYKLIDLPVFNLAELRGGAILRCGLGILKKMTEGTEEEFPDALLPLLELDDEEIKIDLVRQILEFSARVFSAHNKRLAEKQVSQALKIVFDEKGENMKPTIFDEKFEEGVAVGEARGEARGKARGKTEGKAEGKAETVLVILRDRFHRIPKWLETAILQMSDPTALDSWAIQAARCQSLGEFEKALR